MKRTPGPWIVQQVETARNGYDDWQTYTIRSSPANHCLAVVGEVDHATAPSNKANAALIAAAPDLLRALQDLIPLLDSELDAVENWQDEAKAARKALRKATTI
jgi:hypothetical protein